jgi:hypothetical protein
MQRQTTSGNRQWPTLEGRFKQPLTSRVEAVRQLQTMMQITPLAKAVLKQSKNGSSNGRGRTGN